MIGCCWIAIIDNSPSSFNMYNEIGDVTLLNLRFSNSFRKSGTFIASSISSMYCTNSLSLSIAWKIKLYQNVLESTKSTALKTLFNLGLGKDAVIFFLPSTETGLFFFLSGLSHSQSVTSHLFNNKLVMISIIAR